jgi:type I restriction enzyme M protein
LNDPGGYLTLTDIARLTEVGISAVSNWRKRHRDFPRPRVTGTQELFPAAELATWLEQRKIAKNGLKEGEPPGTTYLHRFLRNSGRESPSVAVPSTAPEGVSAGREEAASLWKLMDRFRYSAYDPASATEWILGLLYVRATSAASWRSLVGTHDPHELRAALSRITLRSGAGERETRLFPEPASPNSPDRELFEAIRVIDGLTIGGRVGAGSLTARLFEELLDGSERRSRAWGGRYTPSSLARCLAGLFDFEAGARVYDPYCGLGELLAALPANLQLSGQVPGDRLTNVVSANLAVHGVDVDLRRGGAVPEQDAFAGERFDYVLTNPPFNVPVLDTSRSARWPFGDPPMQSANFAWLQHVLMKLEPGGRAAVLMPAMTATSDGRESEIRARMVAAGVVECMIALPGQLFGGIAIAPIVWILHRPPGPAKPAELLFIDAGEMGYLVDRGHRRLYDEEIARITSEYRTWSGHNRSAAYEAKHGFARSVGLPEIEANGHLLDPALYVHEDADERVPAQGLLEMISASRRELAELDERLNAVRLDVSRSLEPITRAPSPGWAQARLGEICAVAAGPGSIRRHGTGPSETVLVLPRNIHSGRVDNGELDTVETTTAHKFARYRLVPGDIVCARTGTLGRYGLVGAGEAGWLVGPGCMRLRPGTQVHPCYLAHYLNGASAYRWLMRHATGSPIQYISASRLSELPVQLPPMEVQREIAAALDAAQEQISIHRRAVTATEELRDALLPLFLTPGSER